MVERQAATLRASRPIEHQPDTERADETAGTAAHAVQARTTKALVLLRWRQQLGTPLGGSPTALTLTAMGRLPKLLSAIG
jgi:hypothetical protein